MKTTDAASFAVRPIRVADAGQVMTLQRAAFVVEARIYGDADMPALTQSLTQVEDELQGNDGCVAVDGERIVGALRARVDGDVLLIGRIATAPDREGEGIATAMLDAVEEHARSAGCRWAELFTGSRSEANLALYVGRGFAESERIDQGDGTAQVFLRKAL